MGRWLPGVLKTQWTRERTTHDASNEREMKTRTLISLTIVLAALASDALATTYSTNFALNEDPILEGGNWVNGKSVGVDWANIATQSGLAYGRQSGLIQYDDSTALLTGSWGPNQTVQATVHSVNQNGAIYEEVELRLRSSLSAHSLKGYEVNFRCLKTSNAYAQIVRWNGPLGGFTVLGSSSGAQYGVANGDVVKATIVGNVITAYINNVQVLQVTDNTYATGNPGMGFYLEGTTVTSTQLDYGFTNYVATDGVSSPPLPPTNLHVVP
jgi:hypothetical protein